MLLVFDTHPVQYRDPLWRAVSAQLGDKFHVAYGSDFSVRGAADCGFGVAVSWDSDLLEGYDFTILPSEVDVPLQGRDSLSGQGVTEILDRDNPSVILLTGMTYEYEHTVIREAKRRNIPLWLRCETQDRAFQRSLLKDKLRYSYYCLAYKNFSHFFAIGQLNKAHYLRHRVLDSKISMARYCTPDRYEQLGVSELKERRRRIRKRFGIADSRFCVGFSGKLIEKKNPLLLLQALQRLPLDTCKQIHLHFVGSGVLEKHLCQEAEKAMNELGVAVSFAGFVNQSEIADHYLAMDTLVLPSRQMGETWGLVANEALQAGCGVIVSEHVGCGADFGEWERFRIIRDDNPHDLALATTELKRFSRRFDWARSFLSPYSIEASAKAIVNQFQSCQP